MTKVKFQEPFVIYYNKKYAFNVKMYRSLLVCNKIYHYLCLKNENKK